MADPCELTSAHQPALWLAEGVWAAILLVCCCLLLPSIRPIPAIHTNRQQSRCVFGSCTASKYLLSSCMSNLGLGTHALQGHYNKHIRAVSFNILHLALQPSSNCRNVSSQILQQPWPQARSYPPHPYPDTPASPVEVHVACMCCQCMHPASTHSFHLHRCLSPRR
jgi:hypothetical protein